MVMGEMMHRVIQVPRTGYQGVNSTSEADRDFLNANLSNRFRLLPPSLSEPSVIPPGAPLLSDPLFWSGRTVARLSG